MTLSCWRGRTIAAIGLGVVGVLSACGRVGFDTPSADAHDVPDAPFGARRTYFKASNTMFGQSFGLALAFSADGNTLAISGYRENSAARGINGDQLDQSALGAGAVYVFVRTGGTWVQQAYVKASNTDGQDGFGTGVALSADGNTLAVGARGERSGATGIGGNEADNSVTLAGAAYVFVRSGATWSQQAYVKASNTGSGDKFGDSVALSADGNTLAVSAFDEQSNATGVNGNQADNSLLIAGAVYVYARSGTAWSQEAYVKATNTRQLSQFGAGLALSGDGNTLAVGANLESSNATGVDGNQSDTSAAAAGAAYLYKRVGGVWSPDAYVKASNTRGNQIFGLRLALSGDGNTLAVGASNEASAATGINGDQSDSSSSGAGAVYVYTRAGTTWSQQAYVKASNTAAGDEFGFSVALSGDGDALIVGARSEASAAPGIDGDQLDDTAPASGAGYLFTRTGTTWIHQAYLKGPAPHAGDSWGFAMALAGDGSAVALAGYEEASAATGVNGDFTDTSAPAAGAVYVYE